MAESYSVKAILSAQDKNFSSIMKSCQGYANNLKTTLTGGLGFGAMAAIGGKAMSLVTNSVSDLSKETIETSDSMYKLQAAMRFSGYSEAEIQRIAGATGTLKTYADKTVFSLQDVMSTFGSLSANGIKDADKLTEAVGNAVAVFGGGAKEYSSVALAFSQAMSAGALHAQDWNQIINASPQLAGGLRKELIKLNPTLGNDFKGAMEKGAITADMLGQAINNIGMTDMAKEAATSVTTFEGAMGNLEASAVSGMMKLYDTFAKPKVIDAINGMTGKVEAGFDKLSTGIPKAIEIISPYWDVFKDDAVKVGKAFGEAAESIVGEVENLTGAFGKKESVENFSDSLGTATGALTTFADFLKDHDKEVAKAITLLPKLYVAFKGFKIVSAIAPGVKTFAGAIVSMTGKGIATLAGKLFGVAAGEKAVGTASKESSGTIVESAKAFVAIGAGVALIAAGFSLLAIFSRANRTSWTTGSRSTDRHDGCSGRLNGCCQKCGAGYDGRSNRIHCLWCSCPDCGSGCVASGNGNTGPWRRSYGSWGRTSVDGSCIPCCIIRSFSNGRNTDSLNSIIIRSCGRNGSIGCCSGCVWSSYGRWRSWHPCNGGSIKVCQFKHEIHSR